MSAAKLWNSDDELFAMVQREPFTCVVGDVIDKSNPEHYYSPPASEIYGQVHGPDYDAGIGNRL